MYDFDSLNKEANGKDPAGNPNPTLEGVVLAIIAAILILSLFLFTELLYIIIERAWS